MARADLLKRLFRSYQGRDDASFRDVAEEIIEEERRKHHVVVARELERILANGLDAPSRFGAAPALVEFDPPPKDSERGTTLLDVRMPDRYIQDLVLDEGITALIGRAVREFRDWDVLATNGLTPAHRLLFCGPSG